MGKVRLVVRNGGPLKVEGDVELVDGKGNAFDRGERSVILLCRCGNTRNRPFCDGSHCRLAFETVADDST